MSSRLFKTAFVLFRRGLVATIRNLDPGGVVHGFRVGDGQSTRCYLSPDRRFTTTAPGHTINVWMSPTTPASARTSFSKANESPSSLHRDGIGGEIPESMCLPNKHEHDRSRICTPHPRASQIHRLANRVWVLSWGGGDIEFSG